MVDASLMPVKEELSTEQGSEETVEEELAESNYVDGHDMSEPGSGYDVSTTHQDTGHDSNSSDQDSTIAVYAAKKENRNVFRSKILVFTVLLIAAVLVGFFTYYFLSQEEENDFYNQVCTIEN